MLQSSSSSPWAAHATDDGEMHALLALGAVLDPTGRLLPSWAPRRDPYAGAISNSSPGRWSGRPNAVLLPLWLSPQVPMAAAASRAADPPE
jgi:hypothetical protein